MPTYDPDGPVVVAHDVALTLVRHALGSGRQLARPDSASGWAVLVTRGDPVAEIAIARGIPVVSADDDAALVVGLQAFDDGALVSTREAELLSWIEAIRAEEERNQRDSERHVDDRIAFLQAQVDELIAHRAALEKMRVWRAARRLHAWSAAVRRVIPGRRPG